MRLDGDIICQQNEVPIWQAAEGTGSLEDILAEDATAAARTAQRADDRVRSNYYVMMRSRKSASSGISIVQR